MQRPALALGIYGLCSLLLLTYLVWPALRVLALTGISVLLAMIAALLVFEHWGATHYLALGYFIVAGIFLGLALSQNGALLNFAAGCLIIASIGVGFAEATARRAEKAINEPDDGLVLDDEFLVEPVLPRKHAPMLVTQRGTNIYHRVRCRLLKGAAPNTLIDISAAEAEAYGLEACKICRP